ncbi:MAG TPA: diguanylate cyclase [Candidatus Kapabacteria bacterium]|nr:diguanylate cyclase [Candidatus Kapabacteria bacterium]
MMSNGIPVQQRVLVIDDEKPNLKILSDILRNEVDVILAKGGEQGFDKAVRFRPDLILLDVVMPGLDGFQIIDQLRRDERTSTIPVIFISALSDVGHEEKGLMLGACDYIHKPFHAAIVQARVRLHLQLSRQRLLLEQLAHIDPLTAIANRRRYEEVLQTEWHAAARYRTGIALVMVDIDNFKHYNDFYGHAAGDKVLQTVARVISAQLRRPRDFVARYGGEEFVVLLPESNCQGSIDIMQSCCHAVESLRIDNEPVREHPFVTISVGGVSCLPGVLHTPDSFLKIADDMLYRAKHEGKNRVVWHDAEDGGGA